MAEAARIDLNDLRAVVAMLSAPEVPVDRMAACRIDALGRGRFLAFTGVTADDDGVTWGYEHDGGVGGDVEASLDPAEAADSIRGAFALARRLAVPAGLSFSVEVDDDGARAEVRAKGSVGAPLVARAHPNPARALAEATLGALLLLRETPGLRRA